MLGDGLELKGLLLGVVGGEDFIENHYGAVAVSGGEHETLTIG